MYGLMVTAFWRIPATTMLILIKIDLFIIPYKFQYGHCEQLSISVLCIVFEGFLGDQND